MDSMVRRRKVQKISIDSNNDFYVHDVNMYNESPQASIPLSEFEELALERLQLLRIIEQASLKGHKLFSEQWKNTIKEDLVKSGLRKYRRLLNCSSNSPNELDIQARRADHLSHYILRLAYCRSEDLRRWFISREMEWFKLKFLEQSSESIKRFLQINNLTYIPITNEEKSRYMENLIDCTPGYSDVTCESNDFYKVLFTEVVPLVKSRRAFLARGFAFIPMTDLVVCIQSKFRANLSEALNACNHRLPSLDDDRLNNVLSNLHNLYTGKTYVETKDYKDKVNPADIDKLAKQHFPLCMQHIHSVLKTNHHLKHQCRLQYGLFLKGIGLMYDDAMEFWRQEFTKSMDLSKFEKEHSYNIRHMYGKAGKMTDYSPYSCYKIILDNVGPGEHNGCPFKHWDATVVKQKLIERGCGAEGVESIMNLVNHGHFQIACNKYFEYIYGQPPSVAISHPNQYFTESINLAKEKNKK